MKFSIYFLLAFCFIPISLYSQNEASLLVKEGAKLHDRGDFNGAIEKYKKALEINPLSERVLYEMSYTYLAMGEYEEALKYSTKVINLHAKPNILLDAYNVKGGALAATGNYKGAIELLTEAEKSFGDDYLLNYNLGLSYYKINDDINAIKYLEKSINNRIDYPESYFIYAYALCNQKRWLEAYFVLGSYLLLSPDGDSSKDVFGDMYDILQNDLCSTDSMKVPVNGVDHAKITLAIQKVNSAAPNTSQENNYNRFQAGTMAITAELKKMEKDANTGIFWDLIEPTFTDILNSGYMETFCRYISVSAVPESLKWWKDNPQKVDEFKHWFENANNTEEKSETESE